MALLDSLWVETETAAVEVDGSTVTFAAPEASSGILDARNLRVHRVRDCVGDRPLAPVQQRWQPASQCAGQSLERRQATSHRPAVPLAEEALGPCGLAIVEEAHERLLHRPSPCGPEVAAPQRLE